ncbi:MAG: hypothetical protein LDL33_10900 [Desulfomonile sp.]|nr:hypothetical protein [Desulfomonile sp.]
MFETLLTRVFAVTMLYHYAFAAISMAMFGLTLGALAVYLKPAWFPREKTNHHLALCSILFSLTILVGILTHLSVPLIATVSLQTAYAVLITYVVTSVPFVFAGVAVCLVLTRFPSQVNKLYAADLVGAACGCLMTIYFIEFTDGPSAIAVTAFIAGTAAIFYAARDVAQRMVRAVAVVVFAVGAFALGNAALSAFGMPLLRVMWVEGQFEPPGLYEKWNAFARTKVTGDPKALVPVHGWGLSPVYPRDHLVRRLYIKINGISGTYMHQFDGDLSRFEFLKYELANLVHYIRPNAHVAAIGVGGGLEILSALVFQQKSVTGVDINKNILDAVNFEFGNFTGHLDLRRGVRFVHDEARSYIGRQKDTFDIIQSRSIERPEAKVDGALVLAENSLYTVESWKTLLQRLSPDGVLTFTLTQRPEAPYEMYRLVALAVAALKEIGVQDPRPYIFMARLPMSRVFIEKKGGDAWPSVAILVGRKPFTAQDIATLTDVCPKMAFDVVLTPEKAMDPIIERIAAPDGLKHLDEISPHANITPPTDDKPFFFNLLRLRDLLNPESWRYDRNRLGSNLKSIFILLSLLATAGTLTLGCIIVPIRKNRAEPPSEAAPFGLFFAAIGFGYMLVEISQLQRLIIYLGEPTYGLSTVLFSLLLSSGVGSYLCGALIGRKSSTIDLSVLVGIPLSLAAFGLLAPQAMDATRQMEISIRLLTTVCMLFPIGVFMGTAFPLGMHAAARSKSSLTPWLWGINGAASVVGSILAYTVALFSGASTAFWVGVCCYIAAPIAFFVMRRNNEAV